MQPTPPQPKNFLHNIQTGLSAMYKNFANQVNPLASPQVGKKLTSLSAGPKTKVLGASTMAPVNPQEEAIANYMGMAQGFAPQQNVEMPAAMPSSMPMKSNTGFFSPQMFLNPQTGYQQGNSPFMNMMGDGQDAFQNLAQRVVGNAPGFDLSQLGLIGLLGQLGMLGGISLPGLKKKKTTKK